VIRSNDHEYLTQVTKTHICPEHPKLELQVATHPEGGFVIRCGADHSPEEITKRPTRTRDYKEGKLERVDQAFSLIPKADLATGEVLDANMRSAIIGYARVYGLDADRGHVAVMYGKPYITIDGYLYHAYKEEIPYQLRSRPLEEDERKTYKIGADDHAWTAEVIVPRTEQSFTGLGIVTQEEMTAKSKKRPEQLASPVGAAYPWQLAQKRAEWQALRRAFPIGGEVESSGG
jgi:hypothetical protein